MRGHSRLPSKLALFALVAATLTQAACGGATAELQVEMTDQKARMKAMAEAYESQNKRIEGLKGRLEVLEDQVEAARLHSGASSRPLPIVKLAPPHSKGAPDDEDAGEGEPGDGHLHGGAVGYVISQADVDALGGGSSSSGGSSGGGRGPRGPVAPPENAAFAGNIGVAPLPGPGTSLAAVGGQPGASGIDPANDPVGAYKVTYAQYKGGDIAGAIAGFERFATRWPDHSYSDNALFLVGQARFDRSELAAALTAFRRVVDVYPAGNKVPDALLMIGLTLDKLGRPAEGRETLGRLVSLFPGTDAAARAQTTLRGGHM